MELPTAVCVAKSPGVKVVLEYGIACTVCELPDHQVAARSMVVWSPTSTPCADNRSPENDDMTFEDDPNPTSVDS